MAGPFLVGDRLPAKGLPQQQPAAPARREGGSQDRRNQSDHTPFILARGAWDANAMDLNTLFRIKQLTGERNQSQEIKAQSHAPAQLPCKTGPRSSATRGESRTRNMHALLDS